MKTILLDRDGVLNPYMPGDYVKSPSEWRWQENALDALQKLSKHNYQIIIINNSPDDNSIYQLKNQSTIIIEAQSINDHAYNSAI